MTISNTSLLRVSYATRAEAVAARIPSVIKTIQIGPLYYAEWTGDAGLAALTTQGGRYWVPLHTPSPDHWAVNTTPGATDMGAAINAAIQWADASPASGGMIHLRHVSYATSVTILVPYNVILVGQGWHFKNDYVTNGLVIEGSLIQARPGLNATVVHFLPDLTEIETGYPRLNAGLRDICVFGRRSDNQDPGVVDLNTSGVGILIEGASYVSLKNVLAFRCAGNGIEAKSRTVEGTTYSSNNLHFDGVFSIGNYGSAYNMYGGDGTFTDLVGGYNNLDGYNGAMGPVVGSRFWNNKRRGVSLSAFPVQLVGCAVYDNGGAGVLLNSGTGHVISGCAITDNGRNIANTGNERAGIAIASVAGAATITGNHFAKINAGGTPGYGAGDQLYGISAVSGTPAVAISGNTYSGLSANINIGNTSAVRVHDAFGNAEMPHPGFTAIGNIDMDTRNVLNAGAQSRGADQTVTSVASNAITVGNVSLVTFNISGGATINDIACAVDGMAEVVFRNNGTGNIVFTNNTAKIRSNSGSNITLAQYRTCRLMQVATGVWQQV